MMTSIGPFFLGMADFCNNLIAQGIEWSVNKDNLPSDYQSDFLCLPFTWKGQVELVFILYQMILEV